ncbi:hypothetical protein AB0K53_00990 [Streptomyces tuirus]|uniref:DUF6197 family protein n=1 Tax=Streptomyces tuirus TaxID=68278 RepID=UPI00343FD02A
MTETLTRVAPAVLGLEARLVLRGALMDERLAEAAVAFEVNTAHIAGADPIPEITAPLRLTPTPAPCPYNTTLAALLYRARVRIETDGWCRDAIRDEQGARCPIGAIRVEATSRDQADDACVLLLAVIQQDFAGATIPSWNAAQTSAAPVLRYLDRAAQHAHHHNL